MKYIVDTHTFLWFITGDTKLSTKARLIIEDVKNECFVSMASIWEIGIKHSLGKLKSKIPILGLLTDQVADNGFTILPINQHHVVAVSSLPFHHRDPFDRMLVAQARIEKAGLVSVDAAIDAYDVDRFW